MTLGRSRSRRRSRRRPTKRSRSTRSSSRSRRSPTKGSRGRSAGVRLANTAWPIAHGNPFNSDSVRLGFLRPETRKLDTCGGLKVHPMATPLAEFWDYGDPVSVVKGDRGIWYASGFKSVYALQAKGSTGGFKLLSSLKTSAGTIKMEKKKGESSFHGSYALVDRKGDYYVAFGKNVERFRLVGGRLTKGELPRMTGFEEDDHLIGLNVGSKGQLVGATSAGRVLVLRPGASSWGVVDLREGGKGDLRISNSIAMGSDRSGKVNDIAYIGTAYSLVTVNTWTGKVTGKADVPYSGSWGMSRLGPFGTGSSPTTFRLKGVQYATITDGKFTPMSLYVFRIEESGRISGTTSIEVTFGDSDMSTSEQSVCVYVEDGMARILLCNNYSGIESRFDMSDVNLRPLVGKTWLGRVDKLLGLFKALKGTTPETSKAINVNLSTVLLGSGAVGVSLFEFTASAGGGELRERWSNMQVSPLTCIPMQTKKRAWVVGTLTDTGPVSIIGFDARTGRVAAQSPLYEDGPMANTIANRILHNVCYAGVENDGDRIVFGTAGGVFTVTPDYVSSSPPAVTKSGLMAVINGIAGKYNGAKAAIFRYFLTSRVS